jgi:hypothetical protein
LARALRKTFKVVDRVEFRAFALRTVSSTHTTLSEMKDGVNAFDMNVRNGGNLRLIRRRNDPRTKAIFLP